MAISWAKVVELETLEECAWFAAAPGNFVGNGYADGLKDALTVMVENDNWFAVLVGKVNEVVEAHLAMGGEWREGYITGLLEAIAVGRA